MTAGPAGSPLDVLVIGGGQAGLAIGYHLTHVRTAFEIVDADERSGTRGAHAGIRCSCSRPRGTTTCRACRSRRRRTATRARMTSPTTCQATGQVPAAGPLGMYVTSLTRTGGGYVAQRGCRDTGRPTGSRRDRAVPRAVRSADRGRVSTRRAPAPQRRLPALADVPPGKVLVVGAANWAARSPRSSPPRTPWRSGSGNGPCGSAAAAGPRHVGWATARGWTRSPRIRGSVAVVRAGPGASGRVRGGSPAATASGSVPAPRARPARR